MTGQRVRQALLRDEDGDARLGEHEVQPLRGVGRVQRDEGGAGLEDAQQALHQLRRALQAQADAGARSDAEGAQVPGQLIGALIELAIGERGALRLDGDGVRGARGLGGEELMDARLAWVLGARGIPVHQHLLTLRPGEQGEGVDARVRRAERRPQERLEVRHQPRHRGDVEEVGVVLEGAVEAFRCVGEDERQVEAGHVALQLHQAQGEARQRECGGGCVLQGEGDLEEGRVAQGALRSELLDELLEGHVLVLEGAERGLLHTRQYLAEGRVALQARAQRERVDEEADEAFELGDAAAGDGGADGDVVLARVARQQQLPPGQQGHVGGDTLLLA